MSATPSPSSTTNRRVALCRTREPCTSLEARPRVHLGIRRRRTSSKGIVIRRFLTTTRAGMAAREGLVGACKGKEFVFFTGKGGQGKTSVACGTAVALADAGKKTLLISTDPASNLGEALGVLDVSRDGGQATDGLGGVSTDVEMPSKVVENLWCANVDPSDAAEAYREKALGALQARGGTKEELEKAKEGLAGQCTVEIAAFDAFAGILAQETSDFDVVVFDTAPTGHTLRLLGLAWEWSAFFGHNATGASCLGPVEALAAQQSTFAKARDVLADDSKTALLLVSRPEISALTEAARTAAELAQLGIDKAQLVLNGVFESEKNENDIVARAWASKQERALAAVPPKLPIVASVPLAPFNLVGIDALRRLFQTTGGAPETTTETLSESSSKFRTLDAMVDDLAKGPPTVVMLMGKGGTGKTTLAATVGVMLARNGCKVDVTTTDPAAHVAAAIGTTTSSFDIQVDEIDAREATRAYVERAVDVKRNEMDNFTATDEALLREELDSPCTEELAVFDAFAGKILACDDRFVVVDTAPTGHTLMLLDQTGAYQNDVDKYRATTQHEDAASGMTPLEMMRLKATILVVALPEPTPVSEALALDADLSRAGIDVAGFIVNGLIPASGHPTLANRGRAQISEAQRLVKRVEGKPARFGVTAVQWSPEDLVGPAALLSLGGGGGSSEKAPPPPFKEKERRLPPELVTTDEFLTWRADIPLQLLIVSEDDGLDDVADDLQCKGVAVAHTSCPAVARELRLTELPAVILYRGAIELGGVQDASPDDVLALVQAHSKPSAIPVPVTKKATTRPPKKVTPPSMPAVTQAAPKIQERSKEPAKKPLLPSQVMRETGAGGCCAPGGGG